RSGTENAELGMAQPDEGFGADHVVGLQADLGLVPDFEPAVLERPGKSHLGLAGRVALVVCDGLVRPREHALQGLEHDAISPKRFTGAATRASPWIAPIY